MFLFNFIRFYKWIIKNYSRRKYAKRICNVELTWNYYLNECKHIHVVVSTAYYLDQPSLTFFSLEIHLRQLTWKILKNDIQQWIDLKLLFWVRVKRYLLLWIQPHHLNHSFFLRIVLILQYCSKVMNM